MLPIEIAIQEPRVSGVFWIWGGQVSVILIVRITWWERPLLLQLRPSWEHREGRVLAD